MYDVNGKRGGAKYPVFFLPVDNNEYRVAVPHRRFVESNSAPLGREATTEGKLAKNLGTKDVVQQLVHETKFLRCVPAKGCKLFSVADIATMYDDQSKALTLLAKGIEVACQKLGLVLRPEDLSACNRAERIGRLEVETPPRRKRGTKKRQREEQSDDDEEQQPNYDDNIEDDRP